MAFIDFCKRDSGSALVEAVCLTGGECVVLHPIIEKEIEKVRKKVEYYEDKISDGYGTSLQETKLTMYENHLEALESIESAIERILK